MRHYDSNSSYVQNSPSVNSNDEVQIIDPSSPNFLETFVAPQTPTIVPNSSEVIMPLSVDSSNDNISVNDLYIKRDEEETSEEIFIQDGGSYIR